MIDALAHLITTNEFLIGFIAGGVILGFSGLAIGWANGVKSGYDDGWKDAKSTYAESDKLIHRW